VKTFHLGTILTILTGWALAPGGLPAVQELLEYMTGERPLDLGVIRAYMQARIDLRHQFPHLADIHVPRLASPTDRADWLAVQASRFGEQHTVRPISNSGLVLTAKEI